MDLTSLAIGCSGIVTTVLGSSDPEVDAKLSADSSSLPSLDSTKRRLLEFGFIPGTTVKAMHAAPFVNDPISYLVRGTHVALRRSEASRVQIAIPENLAEGTSDTIFGSEGAN